MRDPLRFSFEVNCPVAHAFAIWTTPIDSVAGSQPHRVGSLLPSYQEAAAARGS